MKKCNWILITSLIIISSATFIFGLVKITHTIEPLKAKDVFALQMSFTKDRFVSIIRQWQDQHVINNFLAHFKYDFIYLLSYSLLITLLFITLACLMKKTSIIYWTVLPVSVGLLDAIENTLEIMAIKNYSFNQIIIFLHSVAAMLKFVLILISILVIIWITATWIKREKDKIQ